MRYEFVAMSLRNRVSPHSTILSSFLDDSLGTDSDIGSPFNDRHNSTYISATDRRYSTANYPNDDPLYAIHPFSLMDSPRKSLCAYSGSGSSAKHYKRSDSTDTTSLKTRNPKYLNTNSSNLSALYADKKVTSTSVGNPIGISPVKYRRTPRGTSTTSKDRKSHVRSGSKDMKPLKTRDSKNSTVKCSQGIENAPYKKNEGHTIMDFLRDMFQKQQLCDMLLQHGQGIDRSCARSR